jgi:hypothetical protein
MVQSAACRSTPTATAVSLSNDSGFITARYTNRACFIAGTQTITGQKTFSEDIIVGSTASGTLRYLQNSIDVHTETIVYQSHCSLVHTVYEISWDA